MTADPRLLDELLRADDTYRRRRQMREVIQHVPQLVREASSSGVCGLARHRPPCPASPVSLLNNER
jgi:hypothetical protein